MKKLNLFGAILFTSFCCNAQNINYFLWDRGSSFTPQSTLFNDIDMSSYELISANLSFTDKDQTQKIVLSPFRLTNDPMKFGALTNTKLNLALKDKITTFGIGFGGDNAAPYSRRATKIRNALFNNLPVSSSPMITSPSWEHQLRLLIECQSKDPVKSNCIDSNIIKVFIALDSIKNRQLVLDAFNKAESSENKLLDSILLVYDKRVAKNVIKWTVGYNKQLFPNLFAKGTANDFDSLNHYNSKSDNITGSITYSTNNNQLVIIGTYNQIYARTTAVKSQNVVPY